MLQLSLIRNHYWKSQEIIRDIVIHTLPEVKLKMWASFHRPSFWWELGACVINTPRQYGKTTWLQKIAASYPASDVCMISHLDPKINNWSGKTTSQCHLFVDEPHLIKKEVLDLALDRDWASVTMIGTFDNR